MLVRLAIQARRAGARHISVTSVALDAAGKAEAKKEGYEAVVDPNDPQIAPSVIPWKEYKNEYYRKRGYTVAGPDWKEWSELPEPFKYLGVKVNPDHVLNHGPVWKFFSDWRTALPAAFCLSMPLWMFNVLPPVDERMELACITICAGWLTVKAAGPLFRSWKRSRVATKVDALLTAEREVNEAIASTLTTFKSGTAAIGQMKQVHEAERALRKLEAAAASKRVVSAQRDDLVAQLDYLVGVQSSGAANSQAAVAKSARTQVESLLEKDSSLQQRTIEAAIKALKEGSVAEDVVGPLYTKAVDQARADIASKPTARPLLDQQQVDMFKKRFGFTEETVSEATLKKAQSNPVSLAVLTGRVGGKTPTVGASFAFKHPLSYVKA